MNARAQQIELTLEQRQIEEAVQCVFHTLLLHRSVGKFNYRAEGNYSIGVIGTEDIDCDFIDLTYVRVSSRELAQALRLDVVSIREALRLQQGGDSRVTLEFYQKRKRQWPLPEDVVPWEIWHLQLHVVQLNNETEQQRMRESVGECLAEMVFSICSNINRPQYVPKMPVQTDLPLVFDARFTDIQPYLFKIGHQCGSRTTSPRYDRPGLAGAAGQGLTVTMRQLIKDTLSL